MLGRDWRELEPWRCWCTLLALLGYVTVRTVDIGSTKYLGRELASCNFLESGRPYGVVLISTFRALEFTTSVCTRPFRQALRVKRHFSDTRKSESRWLRREVGDGVRGV